MPFKMLPQSKPMPPEHFAFSLRLFRERGMQEDHWAQYRFIDLLSKPDFPIKKPPISTKGANWQKILVKNPKRFGRLRKSGKDFLVKAAKAYMPNDPDQVPMHWIILPLLTTTPTLGSLAKKAGLQPLTSTDEEAERVLEVSVGLSISNNDEAPAMAWAHEMFSLTAYLMAQGVNEWEVSLKLAQPEPEQKEPFSKLREDMVAHFMMSTMPKTLMPPYNPGDAAKRLFGDSPFP